MMKDAAKLVCTQTLTLKNIIKSETKLSLEGKQNFDSPNTKNEIELRNKEFETNGV